MARKPEVRYWASRKAYCTTIHGKQIVLCEGPEDFPDGKTYTEARRKFTELVFDKPTGLTLADIVSQYLAWAVHHREAGTVRIATMRLKPLSAAYGKKPVAELTSFVVEAWCERERVSRGWSDSTVCLTMTCLQTCLNWAVRSGLLAANPVKQLDKPREPSRGLEVVLSEDQERRVLDAARGTTRELVQVLRDTGARPSEIVSAEAKHYDVQLNALVYAAVPRRGEKRHKTARSGKARTIYLSGESTDIVRKLVAKHPTGPLFRSGMSKLRGKHKGERWGWTGNDVVGIFRRLREKTGIKGLIAYSFRHTYAVRWLRAGKPIAELAVVMGTSLTMLLRHYSHLAQQHDHLRRLVGE